jgi:hypothetical protein
MNNSNTNWLFFIVAVCFILTGITYAQQTYNLEIIFHAECPLDSAETFGIAISSAGDVNNDGYDDIIVGSRAIIWAGAQDTSPGHAYIYYGGSMMDTIVDISLPGEHPLDLFGESVCGLGDINCDSIDDVAVGAPNCAQIDSCGRVYIYFGGSLMDSIPDMILKGIWCGGFGCAIAHGDINGDGWSDIIVGENGPGRVYIYYGGPLLDTISDIVLSGIYSFGHTVGSGGDVNNDGFDDIVVGEDENDEAYPGAGKVYVYFGGNPMDTIPDCWLHGEGVNHYLGWNPIGIVNNRSAFDYMIVGTPFYPYGFPSYAPGKLYILNGGSPMDTLVDWFKHGEDDSSSLGMGSASGGFITNDSMAEFLGGAPIGATTFGKGSVWFGDFPVDSIEDANIQGNISHYNMGWVVASAGDVNDDGRDEILFSNYTADSNQTVWVCRYTGPGVVEQRAKDIEQKIHIYPSVFTDKLTIKYQMNANAQMLLKIYDILGREVMNYSQDNPEGKAAIDVDTHHLPAGVYFIQVEVEGIKEVQKVIKLK